MKNQVKRSLPGPFLKQMESLLGMEEFPEFLNALEKTPATCIRDHSSKYHEPVNGQTPVPWCKKAFILPKRPVFTLDPAFHAGAYYVQEASSTFLWHILGSLDLPKKALMLDLCAAPGGKSTLLSSFLGNDGLLVANEVIKTRNQILKENTIKWGMGNTVVTQNDPSHFSELEGCFDLVLVDAPCSGEGLFRKDPDAINEWSQENVQLCSGRQSRILEQAATLPKPGGYLVYATCTYNEEENENNIRELVRKFDAEQVKIPLQASWGIQEKVIDTSEGEFFGYRFFPHKVIGEGLYLSVLKRKGAESGKGNHQLKSFKHPHLKRLGSGQLKEKNFPMTQFPYTSDFYHLEGHVFALNSEWATTFEKISGPLNIRYFGTEIGEMIRKDFIPSPAWAMSCFSKPGYPQEELDEERAIDYLKKAPILLSTEERGWVLVKFKGLNLGWVKNLGNRTNNYYPKEWRIRLQ